MSEGRPLLPQTAAQNPTYAFAPPATMAAPRENQRNYVFVDEHNRHKRLKVMRACEGCRRRKIKCDAATTNSWPCAACVRLKLTCVPPQVSYEKDSGPQEHTFELETPTEYNAAPISPDEEYQQQVMPQHLGEEVMPPNQVPVSYTDGPRMYSTATYVQTQSGQNGMPYLQIPHQVSPQEVSPSTHQMYGHPQSGHGLVSPESDVSWRTDAAGSNLADALGDLKIDEKAVASYITSEKKTLAEAPAVQEYEIQLPDSSHNLTVRIPPEMMPSEEQALDYFAEFFANVNPYFPVINRQYFYHQWQHSRTSISPLILEAMFACAAFNMDDAHKGNQWLALAAKHEESFKDVPRLSTMQALLILMKARESSPKRGYFYRSWMTLVNLVAMGKDLELDEHLEQHRQGVSCGSIIHDCAIKTRVWHLLYVLEIMVGGPQGRSDFGVQLETVDLSVPESIPGLDAHDLQISRQFVYFMRVARNIRRDNELVKKMKHKKDWATDPEFLDHNQNFAAWQSSLPRELEIVYPEDRSVPWIPNHLVPNLHSFHHLSVLMHFRPQVMAYLNQNDPTWKHVMYTCYSSAKNMCRLQEALMNNYGLHGSLYMLRGMSFTIYTVLTSVLLHLVAITSPDPEMSSEGREYFARHMRVLEQVASVWPMPEMQAQVNALREAFSADVNKPFELKPTFPIGSATPPTNTSPLSASSAGPYRGPTGTSIEQPGQVNYHQASQHHHPITPPISATDREPKTDSPLGQSLGMMNPGQRQNHHLPPNQQVNPQGQWNPVRIFDQWNTAFGTPPPSANQETSPPLRPPTSGNFELRSPQQELHQQSYSPQSAISPHSSQLPGLPSGGAGHIHHGSSSSFSNPAAAPAVPTTGQAPSFVSPSMWQDVVASSFEPGMKRRYTDFSVPSDMMGDMNKRQR